MQIWNPYLKKDIECIEKIQRRATKLVHGFNKMSHEQRLKALGLYSLQRRRLRGDLIETYKILTGKDKIKSDQLFQKATTTEIRGHSLKLYKKSSRLELRKHSFSQRITDHWNKLPAGRCSIRSYHFYFQKEARYLDGQIWALKAESLTSPLTVTVIV